MHARAHHHSSGKIMVNRAIIQPQLSIGAPDDKYEREAEAIADRVVSSPGTTPPPLHRNDEDNPMAIQRMQEEEEGATMQLKAESEAAPLQMKPFGESPNLQMKCAACEEEEQSKIQRKPTAIQCATDGSGMVASSQITRQLASRSGRGQTLPSAVNQEMRSKIGADFSSVRVHTDSTAIQMSRDLGAKAFTHGNDIYFNSGQYDPGSKSGKHLLAHELTHTMQQGKGISRMIQRAETDTSNNCAALPDSRGEVNTYFQNAINTATAAAGGSFTRAKSEFYDLVADNTSLGRSAVEDWVSNTLNARFSDLPTQASTKYDGVGYRIWSNPFFPILNPSMKVNSVCIGSDKLGHFAQQGSEYYDLAHSGGGSRASAIAYGEGTEAGGYGLNSTGVYSNADLAANLAGLGFYEDWQRNFGSFTFDINNYISSRWNEESNPNFYESSVGTQVWVNLLSGVWNAGFSVDSTSSSHQGTMSLTAASQSSISGQLQYMGASGAVAVMLTNGSFTTNTTAVRGGNTPVSGITLTFDWDNGAQSGKMELTSANEQQLSGTWGLGSATAGGGTIKIVK